jgi:hypothetical protein
MLRLGNRPGAMKESTRSENGIATAILFPLLSRSR